MLIAKRKSVTREAPQRGTLGSYLVDFDARRARQRRERFRPPVGFAPRVARSKHSALGASRDPGASHIDDEVSCMNWFLVLQGSWPYVRMVQF
jgi:hypothetical protein